MKNEMQFYCLGYTHDKCDQCKNHAYWNALNQMPDNLRKSLQAKSTRVSSDNCRLTKMSFFIQK